jgi:hypothetical protein
MIVLPFNADRDLPSMFTRALAGRCIDIDSCKTDEVHIYTALAACWRKGSEAATVLLHELENLEAAPSTAGSFDERPVSQALRGLIYVATEAFDLYHQAIPKQLEGRRGKKEIQQIRGYQASVKRFRDPIALMCNRMKHDYREIVMGRIVSQATGERTFVYRINVARGGVQVADRDMHRQGGFASFERTLHEIVHGLLRADFKAFELVRSLSDNHSLPIELKGPSSLGLAYVLETLGSRTPTVAQSEPGLFDGVQVLVDRAVLTRISAKKVPEPTLRTMNATIDEVAPSLQVFTT